MRSTCPRRSTQDSRAFFGPLAKVQAVLPVSGRTRQAVRRVFSHAALTGLLLLAALLVPAVSARAQTSFSFPNTNVGASSSQQIPAPAGVNAAVSTEVLTWGASGIPNLDFTGFGAPNCGSPCTQSVSFVPQAPGVRMGAVVWFGAGHNLLGTTLLSGIGQGGLGVLIPGTMTTVAGTGDWTSVADGILAKTAELNLPTSLALDGAGNLYIADSGNSRIRMVCAGTATTIAGTSCTTKEIFTVAGTSTSIPLSQPSGVAIDGAGNLYIADTGNNVIREVSVVTGIASVIAGTSGSSGFSGDGAVAASAQLSAPDGVAVDGYGNVFIADTGNNRIRVVCASANSVLGVSCQQGYINTVAGGGASLGDNGAATAAQLKSPFTVALDSLGDIFIADSQNNRIRVVCAGASNGSSVLTTACTSQGNIETVAGNGMVGDQGDNAQATSAELNSPSGLALDAAGNLYISDTENMRVRKVNSATGVITTVGGSGGPTYGGDNGVATTAELHGPYGLALDGNGNLFVADYLNERVREIQGTRTIASYPASAAVPQGQKSSATDVIVENDGYSSLTLTSINNPPATYAGIVSVANVTNCAAGSPVTVAGRCTIGAVFEPPSTPIITCQNNQASCTQDDNDSDGGGDLKIVDQTAAGTSVLTTNSPLVIAVSGYATPVNQTTTVLSETPSTNCSSPNSCSSTNGTPAALVATISTGSATGPLGGTVTFTDTFGGNSQVTANVAIVSAGTSNSYENYTATFPLTNLPAGSHSLSACYVVGLDSAHYGSCSIDNGSTFTQLVYESTSVTLVSNASNNKASLGTNVTFTATIAPGGGGVPVAQDGTVTFTSGTNVLCSGAINVSSSMASCTVSLSEGPQSITATYSGDLSNYIDGSSASIPNFDVQAQSIVAASSNNDPSYYGSPVMFTATVTPTGSALPSGTVSFLDGSKQIASGTGTLSGSPATASISTSNLSVGTHTITAQYAGDTSNAPGSSTLTQTVNKAVTAATLAANPSPGIAGKAVALTATVTVVSGASTPTGTVSFADGATPLGSAPVAANGTATLTPILAPGAHALTATYNGDTNDVGSTSVALPFSVILATTSVAVTTSASPSYVLSPITFSASVTGNGGVATGPVTFFVNGASVGTGTLNGNGVATFSYSPQGVGTYNITASYGGDVDDNGSTSMPLSQVVQPIPTTASLGESTTTIPNPQAILVATVLGSSGPMPTGTVTFYSGTSLIGSATLDATGVATFVPDLAAGNFSITASYGGDAIHAPSTSAALSFASTPIDFSVTVNPTTLSIPTTQNATVTITLTSRSGYSDTIGMGCLSLPAAVNCHFSSKTVILGSGTIQTVQLTIDTNNPLGGGQSAGVTKSGVTSLAGLFLPAGILLGLGAWRFRKRHAGLFVAGLALFLAGAMFLNGCSTGFSQSSAAPGSYTFQVGGIGVNSNVSHYQTITLTVTK